MKLLLILLVIFGHQPTIKILPLEQSRNVIAKVVKRIKKVYPNIELLPERELPPLAYNSIRRRYRADKLIAWMGAMAKPNEIYLGITSKDISTTKGSYADWGIFGLSFQPGNACIASSYRLHQSNLEEELFKVGIHELGHSMGLSHCPNPSCYMRDANGSNSTSQEREFCPTCKKLLISKGWYLN